MATTERQIITVDADIAAPVEEVWRLWTGPKHIVHWNNASDDWYTPNAENDVRVGGMLRWRMEARDGSGGFDFSGTYTKVEDQRELEYNLDDGRKVMVSFISEGDKTKVIEKFEPESSNSIDLQKQGWQAIMNNFKKYVESFKNLEKLHFEIDIQANAEKVYKTMIDEEKYSDWTSEFDPDSRFKGSWEKGAKLLFFGTDKEGKAQGMVSRIKEHIPGRFISIEHMGVIEDGKELTSGPAVEVWAGAIENYTFKQENSKTSLEIDVDTAREFKSFFEEAWPKALKRLKNICETEN